jgi:FtsP/CotA-like multicopper oxidase with cupredoxin domain
MAFAQHPPSQALAAVATVLAIGVPGLGTGTSPRTLPVVQANANVARAGILRNGVLTVALEARTSSWRSDGANRPPMTIAAFGEPGKAPLIPGPLLRAPAGTEIRLSIHNSLATPLTFFVPAAVHGGPDRIAAMDSTIVLPGAVGRLAITATAPGNYVYRATTPAGANRVWHLDGLLAGALVVDSSGSLPRPHDRVLVMMETLDSVGTAYFDTVDLAQLRFNVGRGVFTINGRSWPNTERIPATVDDSLHWRVLNASYDVHPMHLHGFYYRVDRFGGPFADQQGRPAEGQMVVTQLMTPFSGMSMSWSPDRPGNWIFHCHFAIHLHPYSESAAPDDPNQRGMVGLVLSVNVAARPGAPATRDLAPARRLRLVAVAESAGTMRSAGRLPDTVPPMRFVLEEQGRHTDTKRAFSPELDLRRGEPVAITIVNHLAEPVAVHWHGIEIQDSYFDGVPGVSGEGKRLTPEIAPGDSFAVRFTPPRSGTFMYHAHMDEVLEEQAGLEGALIVRDSGDAPSPDDHEFFLKGNHLYTGARPVELNGDLDPDTVVLHAGRPARLRLLNLARTTVAPLFSLTARPDSALRLGRDTMVVSWQPLAKDGFDLPVAQRGSRPARQRVGMGETYDFEYTPLQPGILRLEVRGVNDQLLKIRVPIRVVP